MNPRRVGMLPSNRVIRPLQRHLNSINRRACGLLIVGAFFFLLGFFLLRLSSPAPSVPLKVVPVESPVGAVALPPVVDFDSESYYRLIIDNNLFRPLGWTPPRPIERYRLIGTILPRSGNRLPQAIIETTAGKKRYIVSVGDPLDAETEVVSIEGKAVTLSTNGQQRTLHLRIGF